MRFTVPDALAAATLAITMMRAGIETQAGEPQALGFPWWTNLVAAMVYALVFAWAFLNDVHAVLIALCAIPLVFCLFHLHDLRAGNATVWATLVISIAGIIGQVVALVP